MILTTLALLFCLLFHQGATRGEEQLSAESSEESCPVWFTYDPEHNLCLCSDSVEDYITCRQHKNASFLHLGISLGYNKHNEILVASVPYIVPPDKVKSNLIELANNVTVEMSSLCKSLHRTFDLNHDTFCGKCDKTYGPAVYTFGAQCATCQAWNILWYILLQILPITVIYAIVLTFKIHVISPNMFHYIIFCNVVTLAFRFSAFLTMSYMYTSSALHYSMKVILTLTGFWALDFFRFIFPPFCISENLKDMNVPIVDVVPAIYLLILTLIILFLATLHKYQVRLIVWIWKPVQNILVYCKQNRDPCEALSHTYATFFFLFFLKTMYVTMSTILITDAFTDNGTVVMRSTVYLDPTTSYFVGEHLIAVMVMFLISSILILPALLLLIIFHSHIFQKFFQRKVNKRLRVAMRVFVQTFQNGYNDGTRGTHDYRPMAGAYLLCILLVNGMMLICLHSSKYSLNIPWPAGCAFFTSFAVIFGVLKPYKKTSANATAATLSGILAILANLCCFVSQQPEYPHEHQRYLQLGLILALIGLVHVIFTIYITYKIISTLLKPNMNCCLKALPKKLRFSSMCPQHNEGDRLLSNTGLVTSNSQAT